MMLAVPLVLMAFLITGSVDYHARLKGPTNQSNILESNEMVELNKLVRNAIIPDRLFSQMRLYSKSIGGLYNETLRKGRRVLLYKDFQWFRDLFLLLLLALVRFSSKFPIWRWVGRGLSIVPPVSRM